MSNFEKFNAIREYYAHALPEWLADYEATGCMEFDPYDCDLALIFTPIEASVWSDIRNLGVPFYPQLPALNYFLDFGNPFLKIGIECDGKAWHEYELDKARDRRLASAGWMIFRIEGHECKRIVEPWIEFEDEDSEKVRRYFMETSEGVISAIRRKYFAAIENDKYAELIESTLFEHRSTPETFPVPRPRKSSQPRLAADTLVEYFERLQARMKRAEAREAEQGIR
jgi:hypothetical protein